MAYSSSGRSCSQVPPRHSRPEPSQEFGNLITARLRAPVGIFRPAPHQLLRRTLGGAPIAMDHVRRSVRELPMVARSLVEGAGHQIERAFLVDGAVRKYIRCAAA